MITSPSKKDHSSIYINKKHFTISTLSENFSFLKSGNGTNYTNPTRKLNLAPINLYRLRKISCYGRSTPLSD
jgi:hypothetical protein